MFAIPADKCLIPGDLTVSAPAVLEGIPSETYPSEGAPKWIDTAPPSGIGYDDEKGFHAYEEEAGYYEASVTIGAGPLSQPEQDLRPQGLFVAKFPEQKKPTPPTALKKDASARETVAHERAREEYEAALVLFRRWKIWSLTHRSDSRSTAKIQFNPATKRLPLACGPRSRLDQGKANRSSRAPDCCTTPRSKPHS